MRQAYIDESGRAGDTAFVAMGACDGSPEDWNEFDRRWRAALRENRAPYLHMKEFSGSRGPYTGWTERQRRLLMSACLSTLDDLAIIMLSAVIRTADFHRLAPMTRIELGGDPYFCCFQECLHGSALAGFIDPSFGKVDVVYSQQDEFGSRFRLVFNEWKQIYPQGRSNLGALTFADMRETPGLQLADLLAYESMHYYHLRDVRPDLKPRVPFQALADHQLSMGAGMFKYVPYWKLQMQTESDYWEQIQDILWSDLDTWGHMLLETLAGPVASMSKLRRIAKIRRMGVPYEEIRHLPRRLSGRPTLRIKGKPGRD